MSGDGELVQVPASCVRWTVDVRHKPELNRIPCSSAFRFQGHEWCLWYCYYFGNKDHRLGLQQMSPGPHAPIEFSVQVEWPGIGTEGLPQEGRIDPGAGRPNYRIWRESDSAVLRMCPEFQTQQELRFLVKLTGGDALLATASSSSQTEHSIPEGFQVSCMESLSEDFARLMVQGSNPDVVFKCAGQSIRAHGAVVCARSAVMAAMLGSDMAEGRSRVVRIPDMEPDVFRHFLRYVYSGRLPELTPDLALTLYEVGDQYAVHGLSGRCSRHLVGHLSDQNACDVLVIADARGDGALVEKVVDSMVDRKFPQMGDRWPTFCDQHPRLAKKVLDRVSNLTLIG